jgi:hypothetical protein
VGKTLRYCTVKKVVQKVTTALQRAEIHSTEQIHGKISSSQGDEYENGGLLECYAV